MILKLDWTISAAEKPFERALNCCNDMAEGEKKEKATVRAGGTAGNGTVSRPVRCQRVDRRFKKRRLPNERVERGRNRI